MTRILVISDIHSNYTALKTVLEGVGSFDSVLFAGDIAGFGPHPNKCIEAIRRLKVKSVMGNHDQGIILDDYSGLPQEVGRADAINREIIIKDNLDWLKVQPMTVEQMVEGVSVSLIHANPVTPLKGYVQADEIGHRMNEFHRLTGADLLILGHTHRPYIQRTDNFTVINPGSVGLPRDEARTSFMILEVNDGEFEITHTRLHYDYDVNADAMAKLGLPEKYVKRMRHGPSPR